MIKHVFTIVIGLSMLLTHLNAGAQCQAPTLNCFISPPAAVPGTIIMYEKSYSGAKMDSIGFFQASATSFSIALPDTGKYLFKYIPTSSSYQISYADTGQSWQTATQYLAVCGGTYYPNFICQQYGNLGGTGNGSISGKIVEGNKYGQKGTGVSAPGNPIGGIIVKGGKNPGAQLFAQTTTDAGGNYSFNNLPAGNYFILVDIPGLDTASTHHITLNNNSVTNVGFVIDSAKIVPVTDVSVSEIHKTNYAVSIFPNPSSNYASVHYQLQQPSMVKMDLLDMKGKFIKPLMSSAQQTQGDHSVSVVVSDLPSGIYFIRMDINGDEVIHKLIKTNP